MAAHCDSRRMSASSIFPIRWTPVPVTVSPDATASSSNPRPHWDFSRLKLRTRARNLLTSAWLNVKNIFDRSRQEDPVRYTEQLAEAYPSYPCIYPQDSFCLHHMLSTDLSLSLNSLKDTDDLPVLMSGAICSHLYGSNVDGTISSDIAMESPKTSQIQPKKSFDRDWKEIRHRLERKIAVAATQAISGRPGGADNRSRSKWATPPKQKESRFYRVKNEDKLTTRGANPRTGMVSPSNRTDSSDEDLVPRPRLSQKWKVNGDQWVSVDVGQTTSSRSSPLSFKLAKTVSSAGSGSTDISSSDDWEDRFVVHMPSADDPNPPSMTAEQIRLYQKKMTMLHGVAEPRHEMDASKPSSGSPEPKHTQQTMTTSFIPVLKKGTASNSFSSDSCPSISPPLEGRHQYFSPDEVGRARVSPSADIAKLKQKERVKKLREECFLGCLGVDEKAAKNPDEILLFPNSDDEMDLQISPLTKSDEESDKIKTSSTLRMSQKSKLPLSAGHNIAKSTQTQWAGNLVIPPVLTPAQQTKIPVPSSASPSAVLGKVREGDGVVLTSTSTSTSAGASKVGLQRSRARSALKLPSRPPKFTKDHSRRTPEDDLFFESYFSGPSPGTSNSPAESTKSVPSGLEGEQASTITPSPSTDPIRRNLNDKSKHGHSPASQLRQASSPTATGAPNGLTIDPETPKRQHVAELDGLQVPQQLPSPPLSTSPSPPPAKIKPETVATNENPPIKGKRNTHTIRMEIRMKAEKARQGAAAAKSASERLAAARKHAERVAEARVAYEKAKSQSSTVPKKKETPDELELQRLNTERINEARKAFKAAQAKQAERQAEREAKRESEKQAKREAEKEAKREAEKAARREAELLAKREAEKDAARRAEIRRKEARVKSETRIPTCSSSKKKVEPTISPKEAKSTQKPARKSAVRRQPSPEKKSKRDTKVDDPEISVPTIHSEPCLNDTALNLSMLSLSFSKLHTFLRDHDLFSQILLFCERLLQMASHCFKVCKLLVEAWLQYKETGSLSQPAFDHHQELGDFAADVGQALVNFAVLCFVLVVVVKVVGYILIVTNWMVWLCRPIGWVFGNLLSAVM